MKAEDREFLAELTGLRKYWTALELQGSGKVMCFECAFCRHEQDPQNAEPNLSLPDILARHTEGHLNQIPPARRAAFMAALGMGVKHEDASEQVLGLSGSMMGNFFKSGRVIE